MPSLMARHGLQQATFNGWPLQTAFSTWNPDDPTEQSGNNFVAHVEQAYKKAGPVFACITARQLVFSEARFLYRRYVKGRPGEMFTEPSLQRLETPGPGQTTGELLGRMLQDADLAGNWFGYLTEAGGIQRLRPDWVTVIAGSDGSHPDDLDSERLGYLYQPGGPAGNNPKQFLTVSEVAHFSPLPDPTKHHVGMTPLQAVYSEVNADMKMTQHKGRFFDYAATPNMIVKLQQQLDEPSMVRLRDRLHQRHAGADNAYKTLLLEGGADVSVVGQSFEQMSFKTVQGAGETRIAAAFGIPPVLVGLSEGLQAATYSNYGQARRRFADGTIRPLWRMAAASLQTIVPTPGGAHLWYDDRDIPFLREDAGDVSEIFARDASTTRQLLEAGFTPESAVKAVTNRDMQHLQHTGKVSVQLQTPGEGTETMEVE